MVHRGEQTTQEFPFDLAGSSKEDASPWWVTVLGEVAIGLHRNQLLCLFRFFLKEMTDY